MELIKTADWKNEKHVPAIEILGIEGEDLVVEVSIGKGIPHPNTQEHHIRWIDLFYLPAKGTMLVPIGRAEFGSHGELQTLTETMAIFKFKVPRTGKLVAYSLCNIHGLWKNEVDIPMKK